MEVSATLYMEDSVTFEWRWRVDMHIVVTHRKRSLAKWNYTPVEARLIHVIRTKFQQKLNQYSSRSGGSLKYRALNLVSLPLLVTGS